MKLTFTIDKWDIEVTKVGFTKSKFKVKCAITLE